MKKATSSRLTIIQDTREQLGWDFSGLRDWKGAPIQPDQIKRACLKVGDYSTAGLEDQIAIERKSFDDYFGTISFGRTRFLDEVQRASSYRLFMIIIEAPLSRIAKGHPRHEKMSGATATRTLISWRIRYPWCHFVTCDTRQDAELVALRTLERAAMLHEAGELIPTAPGVTESPLAEFCK